MNTTTEITLFQSAFEGHHIRILGTPDKPWFVASEICEVLGIANYRDAVSRLDDDEKGVATTDTLGGPQQVNIISESGLYQLIFQSRKPEARRFRKWVTGEVLPSIRQHGFFLVTGGIPLAMRQLQAIELQHEAAKLRVEAAILERRAKCARTLPGSVRIVDWLRDRHPHLTPSQLGPVVQRTKQALDRAGLPTGSIYSKTTRRSQITALPNDLDSLTASLSGPNR